MNQGWIKHFKDGQSETGFDHQIRARTASWQHGRLEGLVAVDIRHGSIRVTLNAGEGNWWQSDTLVSTFRGRGMVGSTSYLTRRVQRQIVPTDVDKLFCEIPRGENSTLYRLCEDSKRGVSIPIKDEHVGKWLTVALDVKNKSITITFLDKKK
jgi:hypothetical protein